MNFVPSKKARETARERAAEALAELKAWAAQAEPAEILALDPAVARLIPNGIPTNYPDLSRSYDPGFEVSPAYRASLPDLQNGPAALIRGAQTVLQHVGISNFRLPIRYRQKGGEQITLETSVTGTVSLEADKKGINMSRIMRTFYRHSPRTFSFDVIEAALEDYKTDLDAFDARIEMRFSYPVLMQSLRSGLDGWQYYDIALELSDVAGVRKKIIHLDYVYSSTCPCSLELSEHARVTRGQLATPHAQRSVARISVEELPKKPILWFEDLIEIARTAVPTETQVMVKREDEQAFAELNAANPIFVEDAVRLFCAGLRADQRIGDFRVIASHQESLHSHDAVSILTEGPTFESQSLDPQMFATLIHRG